MEQEKIDSQAGIRKRGFFSARGLCTSPSSVPTHLLLPSKTNSAAAGIFKSNSLCPELATSDDDEAAAAAAAAAAPLPS
ncbi:hypothetical protein IEQ34_004666 [Dendrobium chrysotoxum]|uniref:Uncharacterized protein n=1 Tax=Dendrobium chrysotoxum TaxID=161865 RepID=A0AAV7HHB5_DENCH|nr:hypothetical protein IEQ34_004666 [Dendrobium chrysotoxum]